MRSVRAGCASDFYADVAERKRGGSTHADSRHVLTFQPPAPMLNIAALRSHLQSQVSSVLSSDDKGGFAQLPRWATFADRCCAVAAFKSAVASTKAAALEQVHATKDAALQHVNHGKEYALQHVNATKAAAVDAVSTRVGAALDLAHHGKDLAYEHVNATKEVAMQRVNATKQFAFTTTETLVHALRETPLFVSAVYATETRVCSVVNFITEVASSTVDIVLPEPQAAPEPVIINPLIPEETPALGVQSVRAFAKIAHVTDKV